MPVSNCLNLFAYGSLMNRDELATNLVLPNSEVDRRLRIRVAELPGFRRVYNKLDRSAGGAVLNVAADVESSVVGILYMDITNQELGMLDAAYPGHLPRKPVEVMVEAEKVPATVYLAKEVDAGASVAADYEAYLLHLVEGLGEPILSNYREYTFRADGAPQYRAPDAASPAASPEAPA